MGGEQPCKFSGGRTFEVFGEAPTSAEPCEGTLDDPASGQEPEALDPGRPLDDLNRPRSAMGECIDKLFAAITPIGKDVVKPWKAVSQALQQRNGTIDILNVGRMNMYSQ